MLTRNKYIDISIFIRHIYTASLNLTGSLGIFENENWASAFHLLAWIFTSAYTVFSSLVNPCIPRAHQCTGELLYTSPQKWHFFRPDIFIGFCGILNKTKAYQGLTLGTLAVHEFYQCVCDLRFTGEPMHYQCVYDLRFTSEPMHYSEYPYTYIEISIAIQHIYTASLSLTGSLGIFEIENWGSAFHISAWILQVRTRSSVHWWTHWFLDVLWFLHHIMDPPSHHCSSHHILSPPSWKLKFCVLPYGVKQHQFTCELL